MSTTPPSSGLPGPPSPGPRPWWRPLRRLLLGLVLAYGLVCAWMFLIQRTLQYVPDPQEVAPASVALSGVQALRLTTTDGERLVAWWAPPPDAAAPVVLYLHGNGGNLAARADRFAWIVGHGAGLLALSWRGYGGSTGTPTQAGLVADARAAWRALSQGDGTAIDPTIDPAWAGPRAPVAPARVVIFGESLGTALAVLLAAEVGAAAVVLDSAFLSGLDVARHRYPWLPVAWLMRDPLRADLAAPRVGSPVLQVHCREDPVTPLVSAEGLHALLPRALPLVVVPGRCHTPPLDSFGPALAAMLRLPQETAVTGQVR